MESEETYPTLAAIAFFEILKSPMNMARTQEGSVGVITETIMRGDMWDLVGKFMLYVFLFLVGFAMIHNMIKAWNETKVQPITEVKRYFYLKETVLCVQCDCIFSIKDYKQCPSCGNTSTYYHIDFAFLPEEIKINSLKLKGVTLQ